jgi:hypothetical protein
VSTPDDLQREHDRSCRTGHPRARAGGGCVFGRGKGAASQRCRTLFGSAELAWLRAEDVRRFLEPCQLAEMTPTGGTVRSGCDPFQTVPRHRPGGRSTPCSPRSHRQNRGNRGRYSWADLLRLVDAIKRLAFDKSLPATEAPGKDRRPVSRKGRAAAKLALGVRSPGGHGDSQPWPCPRTPSRARRRSRSVWGRGGGTLSSSGARLAPEIEAYERGYRDGREEEGRGCGSMRSPRLLVEVPAGACIVAPGPLTVMR